MTRPSIVECRALIAACEIAELDGLLASLESDPRAGVRELATSHRRALARQSAESERLGGLMALQRELHDQGFVVVAGVDEVGRGALAGPVTAAAVVLDVECAITGLNDSKRLTPQRRRQLAAAVRAQALGVGVAHVAAHEIDALGIGPATRLAWRRALEGLGCAVDHVLVDGNDRRVPVPATAVVRGDSACACIAAASIVAKVERDELMQDLAAEHPGYRLDVNKGYGTAEHISSIRTLGPTPIHRRSFAPCSSLPLF